MSADIISMGEHWDAIAQQRLEAYQNAARKAHETLSLSDCLAAGVARREWLDIFESPAQRKASVVFVNFGRCEDD